MTAAVPLVALDQVTGRIGRTTILRGVDLMLGAGEAVGIFGANGAGKTTLLRMIATLLPPAGGEARVLGADVTTAARFDVRPRIGMIGHVPALYPELTLGENLEFVGRVTGLPADAAADALEAVGLAGAAERAARVCSHGMQRRTEFARELMRQPDLLLLDEPHSALDPSAVDLVEHLVEQTTLRGGAVIVVSHDRERVGAMVGRSLALTEGGLA